MAASKSSDIAPHSSGVVSIRTRMLVSWFVAKTVCASGGTDVTLTETSPSDDCQGPDSAQCKVADSSRRPSSGGSVLFMNRHSLVWFSDAGMEVTLRSPPIRRRAAGQ
jgi:hypothetical protein